MRTAPSLKQLWKPVSLVLLLLFLAAHAPAAENDPYYKDKELNILVRRRVRRGRAPRLVGRHLGRFSRETHP